MFITSVSIPFPSTASAPPEGDLTAAAVLFGVTALILLVALVVSMGLIAARRRARGRAERRAAAAPTEPLPDAWQEAGRRAQPYEQKEE